MKITQISDTDMSHWYPGTQHFACENGRFIAAHADQFLGNDTVQHTETRHGKPAVRRGVHWIVKTPTVIVWCNEDAVAESLTPAWQFEPGTPLVDALAQAGFELSP